jgi:hypothetical protein
VTLGNILAQSGFFADSRGAAQAAVKVMAGQELGFGPVASMTGIYIVKGRVTLSANLMAAAIQRSQYAFRVREHTAESCVIDFYGPKLDGPGMEKLGTSAFSMQDAQQAGLAGSETYKKFPRNMLYARALSNGAKWYCPDVFGGGPAYTPDELTDQVTYDTDGQITAVVEDATPPAQQQERPAGIGRTAARQLDHALERYTEAGLPFERLEMQAASIGGEIDTGDSGPHAWHLLTREQGKALFDWMIEQAEAVAEQAEAEA